MKKKKKTKKNGQRPHSQTTNRPRVLFAVADSEAGYTAYKIWRLVKKVKDDTGWDVIGMTNSQWVAQEGQKFGLTVEQVDIQAPPVSREDRLWAADELIRKTADMQIQGSRLPMWKVMAMDDFMGSLLLLGAQPTCSLEADLIIVPLMGVDNNTKEGCGLYTWMVAQAREKGIPIIGVEVSPLGNKHTLSQLPADHYAVKTNWAKEFLIRKKIAQPDQVSVLKWEEAYCLWPGQEEHTAAYLEQEALLRRMLGIPMDRFIILIPHHFAFLWEIRKILGALSRISQPLSVVIRINPEASRRQYSEREIVLKTYAKELSALPQVVIDEKIGTGLLLQLADVVISPFAGGTTEQALRSNKPTIICQALGEEGWQDGSLYWEPTPDKIPELITTWWEDGLLHQTRLVHIAERLVGQQCTVAA